MYKLVGAYKMTCCFRLMACTTADKMGQSFFIDNCCCIKVMVGGCLLHNWRPAALYFTVLYTL